MSINNEEITIVVPIKVKPEYRDQVRSRLSDLARKTNQETGNICYVLHEVTGKPNEFIIYEQWKNQAALDFHMEQSYLKDFLKDSENLLSEAVQGILCREFI